MVRRSGLEPSTVSDVRFIRVEQIETEEFNKIINDDEDGQGLLFKSFET